MLLAEQLKTLLFKILGMFIFMDPAVEAILIS